ncbi:MAG: UbiA family prenyltransferase, partial [Planctomycetes bacterium]|nr:UbiA family prenyltransferase [Planctomycetota bacterium]
MAERVESAVDAESSATLRDFLELLRPMQWVKNVVVFAGPAAGLKLAEATTFAHAFVAFGAFCLASSATYAINDVLDRTADSRHPVKRQRPVARGAIQPSTAIAVGVCLAIISLTMASFALSYRVAAVVFLYFVLTLAYS